jgi:two-component system NtrC family response regulator/two-component system response regulator HydG
VDFRLVAATNRDLDGEVASGRFRQELYYRLKVVTLSLPPLRARGEDVPLLVAHFIARFNAQLDRNVVRVAPELLASLRSYPWPGNVRELRNVVENMVLFCRGEELTLADLPPEHREGRPVEVREAPGEWAPRPMAEIEREAILRTLDLTGGHRAKAAQLLGIGLRTLQRKLKEYGAAAVGEEVEE